MPVHRILLVVSHTHVLLANLQSPRSLTRTTPHQSMITIALTHPRFAAGAPCRPCGNSPSSAAERRARRRPQAEAAQRLQCACSVWGSTLYLHTIPSIICPAFVCVCGRRLFRGQLLHLSLLRRRPGGGRGCVGRHTGHHHSNHHQPTAGCRPRPLRHHSHRQAPMMMTHVPQAAPRASAEAKRGPATSAAVQLPAALPRSSPRAPRAWLGWVDGWSCGLTAT